MRILIIGGTRFQGRYLVDALAARGHQVTVFHRGTHPMQNAGAVDILGDRTDESTLSPLRGASFDWVIDTCAYVPEHIRTILGPLSSIGRYCLISSAYVYENPANQPDEDAQRRRLPDGSPGLTAETYGAYKALCEDELVRHFPGTALILRPSVLIGPGDHTGRFAFWIRTFYRLQRGWLPGAGAQTIQTLDVRDLTQFTVRLIEDSRTGPVNAAAVPTPFDLFAGAVNEAVNPGGNPVLDSAGRQLADAALDAGALPLYAPQSSETYQTRRAQEWGLTCRSLGESAHDVLTYERDNGFPKYAYSELEEKVVRILA